MIALTMTSNQLDRRKLYRKLLAVPVRTTWLIAMAAPIALLPMMAARGAFVPALLLLTLAASVVTDLLWRRILNVTTLAGFTWLMILHAIAALGFVDASRLGLIPLIDAAIGLGACFGLSLGLYIMFRGGEGDVKLVALIGFALGAWHGLEAMVAAYLLAAAAAVLMIVARLISGRISLVGTLPMAPFFAAGVIFTLVAPR